jgi:hypothetical protein
MPGRLGTSTSAESKEEGYIHSVVFDKQFLPFVLHLTLAQLLDKKVDIRLLRRVGESCWKRKLKTPFVGE